MLTNGSLTLSDSDTTFYSASSVIAMIPMSVAVHLSVTSCGGIAYDTSYRVTKSSQTHNVRTLFLPSKIHVDLSNNHWYDSFKIYFQWWKQDQNVKTKTSKQQQECITEKKLFCCNTHACYQKITWYKNIKKWWPCSNVWHCFCTYCIKEHRCILHFSVIMSHSVLSGTYMCWKQDQKYKTKTKTQVGLRPVLS